MGKGTKIQLMYYGMVYTILQHNGFFLRGKKLVRLTSPVASIANYSVRMKIIEQQYILLIL